MRKPLKALFAALVFATGLVLSNTTPSCGADKYASKQDMRRSIASNEAMIARFQKELELLGDNHSARRKLEFKIGTLEVENQNLMRSLDGVSRQSTETRMPAEKKVLEDLLGSDWARMSMQEKQRFVYTGIGGLERQGVFITRPPIDYILAIDKIIFTDPKMSKEPLDNIFVFCVHDAEPQTRDAIRRISKESI